MASKEHRRPNIMLVLTDDQGCWAMGCAGNPEVRTPNLNRLAGTGIRFNNFFCASPVCSPARASLLTGRIPSQHGVHDWLRAGNTTIEKDRGGELIEYLKGQTAYTDILAGHGYYCGISGKWHLGDSHHAQKGLTFWEVHAMGGGVYYGAPMIRNGRVYDEQGYVTDVITDNALKFLDEQVEREVPFYLSVHYTAPHSPWGRKQHPADLYDAYFNECRFESVPDVPIHPWQVKGLIEADKKNRREILSGYFAAVTAMDKNVGRLLDWLEEKGLRDNTLVLFTSDNGMNMGHHGVYGKGNGTFPQNMFDSSVKVPFIVSQPGRVPENEICEELLSHYDVMPTLLDVAGAENPEAGKLPGRSFAALLSGERMKGRSNVVVYDEYGPVRMIRNREWKYVHRYPYGPNELYDLAHDPDEAKNLIECSDCRDKVVEMKAGLESWFVRYVDPMLDGTHEAVYGAGQIGLAGPAGEGEKRFNKKWSRLLE